MSNTVSDGNIVATDHGHIVVIRWNDTRNNQNQITTLERSDARNLYALLGSLLGGAVTATQ